MTSSKTKIIFEQNTQKLINESNTRSQQNENPLKKCVKMSAIKFSHNYKFFSKFNSQMPSYMLQQRGFMMVQQSNIRDVKPKNSRKIIRKGWINGK